MSTIIYTLEKCVKCLKCIKVCPTGAISMHESRIHVDKDKCINCGTCMDACNHRGLQTKGSSLEDLKDYDYCVALVPTAIYGDCSTLEEVRTLLNVIRKLGFDQVVDLSVYDGCIYDENMKFIEGENQLACMISSTCPVINKLIENKYPMLLQNKVPFAYSADLAAKKVREEAAHIAGKVGIFLLCECIAKLTLAKNPYGNGNTEIDHAISLADLFPMIRKNRVLEGEMVDVSVDGLKQTDTRLFIANKMKKNCMVADGLAKVENVLELLEFGQIKSIEYFHLTNCLNGCIGGDLLWGNSFDKSVNMEKLVQEANAPVISLAHSELLSKSDLKNDLDQRSHQEKLVAFEALNKQLEKLPGFDCGACGYPSCRALAEEIVKGTGKLESCQVLK